MYAAKLVNNNNINIVNNKEISNIEVIEVK
jgi:hypothetical protein